MNSTLFSSSILEIIESDPSGAAVRGVNLSQLDYSYSNYNTSYSQEYVLEALLPNLYSMTRSSSDASTLEMYL